MDLPFKSGLDNGVIKDDVAVVQQSSGDDNGEQVTDNWEKNVKGAVRNLRRKSRKDYLESNKMDVLIALHACDTATDDAIWCGIQAGAQIIGRQFSFCYHSYSLVLNCVDSSAITLPCPPYDSLFSLT